MIQIEVGAMLVGRIKNANKTTFKKGEEKGYFDFGGSTVVLLVNKDIKIDDDILAQSAKGIETKVSYGERIGEKC
jgi:phosphatidylserine decarboxylase